MGVPFEAETQRFLGLDSRGGADVERRVDIHLGRGIRGPGFPGPRDAGWGLALSVRRDGSPLDGGVDFGADALLAHADEPGTVHQGVVKGGGERLAAALAEG